MPFAELVRRKAKEVELDELKPDPDAAGVLRGRRSPLSASLGVSVPAHPQAVEVENGSRRAGVVHHDKFAIRKELERRQLTRQQFLAMSASAAAGLVAAACGDDEVLRTTEATPSKIIPPKDIIQTYTPEKVPGEQVGEAADKIAVVKQDSDLKPEDLIAVTEKEPQQTAASQDIQQVSPTAVEMETLPTKEPTLAPSPEPAATQTAISPSPTSIEVSVEPNDGKLLLDKLRAGDLTMLSDEAETIVTEELKKGVQILRTFDWGDGEVVVVDNRGKIMEHLVKTDDGQWSTLQESLEQDSWSGTPNFGIMGMADYDTRPAEFPRRIPLTLGEGVADVDLYQQLLIALSYADMVRVYDFNAPYLVDNRWKYGLIDQVPVDGVSDLRNFIYSNQMQMRTEAIPENVRRVVEVHANQIQGYIDANSGVLGDFPFTATESGSFIQLQGVDIDFKKGVLLGNIDLNPNRSVREVWDDRGGVQSSYWGQYGYCHTGVDDGQLHIFIDAPDLNTPTEIQAGIQFIGFETMAGRGPWYGARWKEVAGSTFTDRAVFVGSKQALVNLDKHTQTFLFQPPPELVFE